MITIEIVCSCEVTCPGCIRFDYENCCKCEGKIWIQTSRRKEE